VDIRADFEAVIKREEICQIKRNAEIVKKFTGLYYNIITVLIATIIQLKKF
jgi:hypothetical protein